MDFSTSNLVISDPMWLLCSWLNICNCNWDSIVFTWPFMTIPSIMAKCVWWANICVCLVPHPFSWVVSCVWYMPWAFASVHVWLLFIVYLLLMYTLAGLLLYFIVLTFLLRTCIFSIFFSSLLSHDDPSAVNSLEPGLHSIVMHRIIDCRHCDNVATSLPIIATNGLWHLLHMQDSKDETSPPCAETWVLLNLYCHTTAQC